MSRRIAEVTGRGKITNMVVKEILEMTPINEKNKEIDLDDTKKIGWHNSKEMRLYICMCVL